MNLHNGRVREQVLCYIRKWHARNTTGETSMALPMSPRQREIATIYASEGKKQVNYHEALSENHQPTIEVDDVHFDVGRPDVSNTGDEISENETAFQWWHEDFFFNLHLHREGGEVQRAVLSVEKNPGGAPDDVFKTGTF